MATSYVFQFREVVRDLDGKAVAATSLFFRAKSRSAAVRMLKKTMKDLGRPLQLDGGNWKSRQLEEDTFCFCYPHLVDSVFGADADETLLNGKPIRH